MYLKGARVAFGATFIAVDAGNRTDRSVNADSVARRAAEQLVNRHAVNLALDVPKRLIDSAEDRGLDRAAPIKCTALDCLPVKDHAIRVLANQVAADLHRSRGAGLRVVFEHFAPADDSGIGRDL